MQEKEKVFLEGRLREIFVKKGIKYLITDLDDTLVDSSKLYGRYMYGFAEKVANESGRPTDEVLGFMNTTLRNMRPIYKVNPMLMRETARFTLANFGFSGNPVFSGVVTADLMHLYEDFPESFEGVHEALDVLEGTGLKMAVATHSDEPWASQKLAKNGLYGYFRGNIFAFPSWGIKSLAEWRSVQQGLGVLPNEFLVTGDNWVADITPNLELGVPREHIFRIETDYGHANIGKIEGITEVHEFRNLPYAIIDRLG